MNEKEKDDLSLPRRDDPNQAEIYDLCSALCEGELTPAGGSRLAELLNSGAPARRLYLRYLAMHETLRSSAGCVGVDAEFKARMAVERLVVEQFCDATSPASTLSNLRNPRPYLYWFAAAAAAMVAVGWGFLYPDGPADSVIADNPKATTPAIESDFSTAMRATGPTVAQVTHATDKITWRNPNASYAVTSRVRVGESLAFHEGKLELTYASGTKLILTGPAEFEVQKEGGRMRLGELVARVPVEGHGFTIETPQGKVVDLGTEFGVVVDDFGISQVCVFEGKVETTPKSLPGAPPHTIELTSGKAVQWNGTSFVPIRFLDRRAKLAADTSPVEHGVDFEGPLVTLTSRNLDQGNWKTIGDVTPTPKGAVLRGEATGRLPHVVTATQLDPTGGEVTVECDLQFEAAHKASVATLTLLTRAASGQSAPGKAWESMLAHAVRCRLHADLRTGDVRLEAGAKQEVDREPTNISWGGFIQPDPDARYHLVMRDDGLNVSFTVSLADDPTVSKTIICRSLFRGYENHVAVEGPAQGVAVVDNLVITQREQRIGRETGGPSLALGEKNAEAPLPVEEALDALAPKNATLLFRDDFSAHELDRTFWTTLGEVSIVDGRAQLGVANRDNHIDTWQPRPYLLSAKPLDFSDGTVTVVGAIRFAENFLHGYGGSFAVMTRADDLRGTGPGWENSILQRGVRSNFWPAAFGFGHSLEMHEKPHSNTISLLAAASFPVAPQGRDYAFLVTDDGATVEATFIELSDPKARGTIRHAAPQGGKVAGRLGLESCWGSPVSIDEVRVYLADPGRR